jgi:predicted DCC family thiol-disulfide oxidoreductase YuxK
MGFVLSVEGIGGGAHVRGWVLYDDSCGFCQRWIPFWESTLRRRGFAIAALQAPWVSPTLRLGDEALLSDLRLLLADGRQISGGDVYRYVMRRIWWAYPAYLLSVAPLSRRAFDWGYRTFAANRYRVSGACRLGPVSRQGAAPDSCNAADALLASEQLGSPAGSSRPRAEEERGGRSD